MPRHAQAGHSNQPTTTRSTKPTTPSKPTSTPTSHSGAKAPAAGSTLTGSVTVTASQGQCASNFVCFVCPQVGQSQETLNLTSLTVNVDVSGSRNAVEFNKGCTGTVGKIVVTTIAQDAVRVGGAQNMTIGGTGSSINCNTTTGQGHQDGIQVTDGSNITFTGIDDECTSATNAQFYVNSVGNGTPTNILFEKGTLKPNPTHVNNVEIGTSSGSGVENSTVCPDARSTPIMVMSVNRAVDVGNKFPTAC